MHEQFESRNLLSSFKEYLDKQLKQDSKQNYWHDDDTFRPRESGIQIRCEGLHSFLAHPEKIFDYFNKKDLITELDCLYDLIVKKKLGFKAPCYEFLSDLLKKGIKPPEFIETVCMCINTISGLALALSAKGELNQKSKEKTLEMLGRAMNWLNSSWSLGLPVIEDEQKGIGWGGFKTTGDISVYATWAVISILPTVKKVDELLDGKRKKASAELQGYVENVGLWLMDFGKQQSERWEAGEWDMPKECVIYNVYGLSAATSLMLYLPPSDVKKALENAQEDERNQDFLQFLRNFLRTVIQDILILWERSEEDFAETEQIDVGAMVDGKWKKIPYDDCSIVPMALHALSVICSNFKDELKGITREDEGKKGEVLYDSIERTIPRMFEHIKNNFWDAERGVVIKPVGKDGRRKFCIYMMDRVVHAIVAYENWKGNKPPPPEDTETQRLLKMLMSEVQGIRQDVGIKLTKMQHEINGEIRMIPGKVLTILEEQQQSEQEHDQFE